MSEEDFLELLESACKRPKLYTTYGSFYETVAFLEGFANGADVGNNLAHFSLTPFHQWLVKPMNTPFGRFSWEFFREQFKTDSEAFENLARLYREYLKL